MIILIFIIISIFLIIFNNKGSKNLKIGNNTSSQEIVEYILNISSYECKIEVEVNSNKNKNKYILKQQYISPDISTQEVIEPTNIAGVKVIKNGDNLKIENTNLNLTTIFEKYEYISENSLDLSSFIEDYKNNKDSNFKEETNQIIMHTTANYENRNVKYKTLYIDKNTAIPTKMEIKDNNKNTTVYILYNEVNVNSLNPKNILAFETNNIIEEI